jgi:tetratricopeptide (TPR) repeat protein
VWRPGGDPSWPGLLFPPPSRGGDPRAGPVGDLAWRSRFAPQPTLWRSERLPPTAGQAFAAGLAKLGALDPLAARPDLERAARLAPGDAGVHLVLAYTLGLLGERRLARDEAERAARRSSGLGRADQLLVEGCWLATRGRWEEAAERHRALWTFTPSLEVGLALAEIEAAAGRPARAAAILAELLEIRGGERAAPELRLWTDFVAAANADRASDYPAQQAAATRLLSVPTSPFVAARARVLRARALRRRGRPDEAAVDLAAASRQAEAIGDTRGIAAARLETGTLRRRRGELADGLADYRAARALAEGLGDQELAAQALDAEGMAALVSGDLPGARRLCEVARRLHREAGEPVGEAMSQNSLSILDQVEGDFDRAARRLDNARELLLRRNAPGSVLGTITHNLATVDAARGQLRRAAGGFAAAARIKEQAGEYPIALAAWRNYAIACRETGELGKVERAAERMVSLAEHCTNEPELGSLDLVRGMLAFERGELAAADRHLRAAGERLQGGSRQFVRLLLASVEAEGGGNRSAARLAGEIAAWAREARVTPIESSARALEAEQWTLLGQGARARRAVAAMATPAGTALEMLTTRRASALVASLEGRSDEARDELQRISADAERVGLVRHHLAAEAALLRIEAPRLTPAGRERARRAADLASRHGFRRLVGTFERLLATPPPPMPTGPGARARAATQGAPPLPAPPSITPKRPLVPSREPSAPGLYGRVCG